VLRVSALVTLLPKSLYSRAEITRYDSGADVPRCPSSSLVRPVTQILLTFLMGYFMIPEPFLVSTPNDRKSSVKKIFRCKTGIFVLEL
jgi:hypothetical protein